MKIYRKEHKEHKAVTSEASNAATDKKIKPDCKGYLEPIPPAGKWMVSGSAVKKVGRKEIKNLDSP